MANDPAYSDIQGPLINGLKDRVTGCVFAGRCASATDLCRSVAPALEVKISGHLAACHYALKQMVPA